MWFMDAAAVEERFPQLAPTMRQVPRTPWGGGYGWLILKAATKGSETVTIAYPHGTDSSAGIGSIVADGRKQKRSDYQP